MKTNTHTADMENGRRTRFLLGLIVALSLCFTALELTTRDDAGDDAKSAEQRQKLNDPDYQKLKKWMPGSLIDDLTDRKLI